MYLSLGKLWKKQVNKLKDAIALFSNDTNFIGKKDVELWVTRWLE